MTTELRGPTKTGRCAAAILHMDMLHRLTVFAIAFLLVGWSFSPASPPQQEASPPVSRLRAEEAPVSIAIAFPAMGGGQRNIMHGGGNTYFHVVVSNDSATPQRVWQEWCSWGYFGLKFEITDEQGNKSLAQKKLRPWEKNFPAFWTLQPRENLVIEVHCADANIWQGFPWPAKGTQTVTMQAIFEFAPDRESRENGVWTGRVVSKADKFVFYH